VDIRKIFALVAATAAALPAAAAEPDAIQKLIDRAEIESLVARYVTALDTLDADAYAGVFTEDAEFNVSGTLHKGRADIRKIVTDLQASRARNDAAGKPSPRLYHVMSNTSIEVLDATNARHQSYAQTVRAGDGSRFIVGFMGRYEDVLVKRDGRWQIKSRNLVSFVPSTATPAPAPAAR
jgi:3-phenylpropionate/cinnamic acid dioxygenase small subunit